VRPVLRNSRFGTAVNNNAFNAHPGDCGCVFIQKSKNLLIHKVIIFKDLPQV